MRFIAAIRRSHFEADAARDTTLGSFERWLAEFQSPLDGGAASRDVAYPRGEAAQLSLAASSRQRD